MPQSRSIIKKIKSTAASGYTMGTVPSFRLAADTNTKCHSTRPHRSLLVSTVVYQHGTSENTLFNLPLLSLLPNLPLHQTGVVPQDKLDLRVCLAALTLVPLPECVSSDQFLRAAQANRESIATVRNFLHQSGYGPIQPPRAPRTNNGRGKMRATDDDEEILYTGRK